MSTLDTKIELPDQTERLIEILQDAGYVTLGFGVLAFQRAQVRRQELAKDLAGRLGSFDDHYEAFEARMDDAVTDLGKRLPEPAAELLGQAHRSARRARHHVATLISRVG